MFQELANLATIGVFGIGLTGAAMAWLHKRISTQIVSSRLEQQASITKDLNGCVARIERETKERLEIAKAASQERAQHDLGVLKSEVAKDIKYQTAISDQTVSMLAAKYEDIKKDLLLWREQSLTAQMALNKLEIQIDSLLNKSNSRGD